MNTNETKAQDYWSANLRLIIGSLIADLGLWVAQQGACLTFLVLIFHYAWRMNKLDEKFGAEE